MAVRGGLTRFARPSGSLFAARSVCPTGCAATRPIPGPRPYGASACAVQNCSRQFCVDPRSGLLIPPQVCNMRKKSPYLRTSSFSNMAVRGGLTRFARPSGSLFAALSVCPTGCASCRPPVGASHPPAGVQHAKKKPVLTYELFLKYGGEGGIRTPDTLPYTHFPGVLLQPLGHLTILLFLCYRNGR